MIAVVVAIIDQSLLRQALDGGILVLAVVEDLEDDQDVGGQLDHSAHHELRGLGLNSKCGYLGNEVDCLGKVAHEPHPDHRVAQALHALGPEVGNQLGEA